jgi:membrane associated rhomboid family serine protease
MFIPYNVDVPMERWPIANWLLISVTCIVSVVVFVAIANSTIFSYPRHLDWFILQRGDDFSFVQMLGNIFAHAGIGHLLGNMIFLFCFGNAINAKLGHFKFLGIYILLGIVADIGWLVLGSGEAAVGASGAIMGIVGMFFVLYPKNDVSVFYWLLRPGSFSLSSYWLILLYLGFDLWGLLSEGEGVAYMAHLAGALNKSSRFSRKHL